MTAQAQIVQIGTVPAPKRRRRRRGERAVVVKPTVTERQYLSLLAKGPLPVTDVAAAIGKNAEIATQALRAIQEKGFAFAEGDAHEPLWYSLSWWLEHNQGIVWHLAHELHKRKRRVDVEDIASEMIIAATRCPPTFRLCGLKFVTYASRSMWNAGLEFCARERHHGVQVPRTLRFSEESPVAIFSLEAAASAHPNMTPDRLSQLADHREPLQAPIDSALFWDRATAGLDERLKRIVIGRFLQDLTLEELSAEIGISRERIRQLEVRAIRHIRALGSLDHYAPEEHAGLTDVMSHGLSSRFDGSEGACLNRQSDGSSAPIRPECPAST